MPCHFIIAVECGDPGKPTNGEQIVKKGFVYGGSVKFVCDKNYTLVGTDVIYCQANRSWSSPVPRCLGTRYRPAKNNKKVCVSPDFDSASKFCKSVFYRLCTRSSNSSKYIENKSIVFIFSLF